MAFSHTFTRACRDSSGNSITATEVVTDNTEGNFDDAALTLPLSSNHEIDWTCVVANLKSISIFADHATVIKTNSSGSPQETITLIAGQNLIWTLGTDGSGKIPFSGDITKLFITVTGSSGLASFKIRSIQHV